MLNENEVDIQPYTDFIQAHHPSFGDSFLSMAFRLEYMVGTRQVTRVVRLMALRVWAVLGPDTHFLVRVVLCRRLWQPKDGTNCWGRKLPLNLNWMLLCPPFILCLKFPALCERPTSVLLRPARFGVCVLARIVPPFLRILPVLDGGGQATQGGGAKLQLVTRLWYLSPPEGSFSSCSLNFGGGPRSGTPDILEG